MTRYVACFGIIIFLLLQAKISLAEEKIVDEKKTVELSAGIGMGGPILFLLNNEDPKNKRTTSLFTTSLSLEMRFPKFTSRTLKFHSTNLSGMGLSVENNDLTIGPFKFSFLNMGIFWNARSSVSLKRVGRKADGTLGSSMEYAVSKKLSITLGYRVYFPLNMFRIFVKYGDYTRLIAEEIFRGAQIQFGLKIRFGTKNKKKKGKRCLTNT